jgi:endoglucanase
VSGTGFIRADGPGLVDGTGRRVVLRGVGLGNWMLPEGYMWRFPQSAPQSPTAIEGLVLDLLGRQAAEVFWRAFRDQFITEEDIAAIALEGFDHVRLPMSHRLLADEAGQPIQDGYDLIDRLVGWCRAHGLRVVLDLHAAPGGQTGTNIDDSTGRPDLFVIGEPFRARTIRLWAEIARRYADEPVIAAYDLLNEPLPPGHGRHAPALVELYRDITAAIRRADPNHLLTYEGTRWSTDWSIFAQRPDPNAMLQFHQYWSPPEIATIRPYLDARDRLALPVYMGEGGENAPPWLQTAFGLYDHEGISWNLWPWKKVATWSSPYSIKAPGHWPDVVAYAEGSGPRPDHGVAEAAFSELLANMELGRCDRRADLLAALFRRAPVRLAPEAFATSGSRSDEAKGAENAFRPEARVRVCSALPGEPVSFDHVDRPWDGSSGFRVVLEPGEWVTYDVAPGGPGTHVAVVELGEPATALPSVSANGADLPVRCSGSSVFATLPDPDTASRWDLRVTAGSAPIVLVAVTVGPG